MFAAQPCTSRSDFSAAKSFGHDDIASSLTRGQSTLSACGGEGPHYLARDSGVEETNAANPTATPRVVRTNTGMGEAAGSTGTAGSGDGALRRGDRAKQVKAGNGNSFMSSRCARAERYVAGISSQGRRHTRAWCAFVREDRLKMASLEQDKRHAVMKVSGKQSLVGSEYLDCYVW